MVRKLPALSLGLLTASLVFTGLGTPSRAEAKSEKWWNPDRGDRVRSERVHRRAARRYERQWRQWRGQRLYRDVVVIRSGYRAPRYRAWRTYVEPEYIYARRIIRVRPVRLYVGASLVIGGVHIRGVYHDHDDFAYGCNFCDARFGDYRGYHAHVMGCSHRPAGYRIECRDWDHGADSWDDDGWRHDHDGGSHRHGDDCDHEYDGRYDDRDEGRDDDDEGRYDEDDDDR